MKLLKKTNQLQPSRLNQAAGSEEKHKTKKTVEDALN